MKGARRGPKVWHTTTCPVMRCASVRRLDISSSPHCLLGASNESSHKIRCTGLRCQHCRLEMLHAPDQYLGVVSPPFRAPAPWPTTSSSWPQRNYCLLQATPRGWHLSCQKLS